jgi:hypothetical protein
MGRGGQLNYTYTLEGIRRVVILCIVRSFEAQNKSVSNLGVYKYELDCEPYWAALQATQCYRCWEWGHTSAERYYSNG